MTGGWSASRTARHLRGENLDQPANSWSLLHFTRLPLWASATHPRTLQSWKIRPNHWSKNTPQRRKPEATLTPLHGWSSDPGNSKCFPPPCFGSRGACWVFTAFKLRLWNTKPLGKSRGKKCQYQVHRSQETLRVKTNKTGTKLKLLMKSEKIIPGLAAEQ